MKIQVGVNKLVGIKVDIKWKPSWGGTRWVSVAPEWELAKREHSSPGCCSLGSRDPILGILLERRPQAPTVQAEQTIWTRKYYEGYQRFTPFSYLWLQIKVQDYDSKVKPWISVFDNHNPFLVKIFRFN